MRALPPYSARPEKTVFDKLLRKSSRRLFWSRLLSRLLLPGVLLAGFVLGLLVREHIAQANPIVDRALYNKLKATQAPGNSAFHRYQLVANSSEEGCYLLDTSSGRVWYITMPGDYYAEPIRSFRSTLPPGEMNR